MLCRLALEDFIIVERGALEFSSGLNVLTGETGAGKSILIDAIGFLAGGRASADFIRAGAERVMVEGTLDAGRSAELSAAAGAAAERCGVEIDADGFLLLRREMGRDGRSRCLANGRQVRVSDLRDLASGLLWIVGQGEQRALTGTAEQEWLIDRFARALPLRQRYREQRARFLRAREELSRNEVARESFAREEEWLRFQLREIEEARIEPGERERLREARQRARLREQDSALLAELEGRLFREEGSILDHLESLSHLLSRTSGEPWNEIRSQIAALREIARELRRSLPSPGEADEENLDRIEERLQRIDRLIRKYGRAESGAAGEAGEESAVLAHLAEVKERIESGERVDSARAEILAELESSRQQTGESGAALSLARRSAAQRFTQSVSQELSALGMEGAVLRFQFRSEPDEEGVDSEEGGIAPGARLRPLENGLERASLLFRSHPSLPEGDLGRVASGGELSRILLAVHAALGRAAPPGCWILDEVDSGVGGETSNRVAERLARMAAHAQVLLVTHLPVIAARASRHFRVVKEEMLGRPAAQVQAVAGEARLEELARMLSGDARSAIARRHARELLASAGKAPGV